MYETMKSVMAPKSAEGSAVPVLDGGPFDALYNENVGAVYKYATSRLGVEEGEDVTAEVFHAALRAIQQEVNVTGAWLMAVVRNKVIDQWRRTERRERKLHLIWEGDSPQVEPHEGLFAAVDRENVLEVLHRLSERHRLLLMLHYVDGYTANDLAEMSGGTGAAVESALARARRAFRSHWTELEKRNA